jgi:signal transduction histidine kinase
MLLELNANLERRVAERTAKVEEQAGKLRELALEVSLAEQRERRKLGTLLHDELAQALALSKLKLTMLEAQPRELRDEATFKSIKETLGTAIHFTRALMNDLSPPMLYDMGFGAAVEELASRIRERHGLDVSVVTNGKVPLPEDLRSFLFLAVREMLINIVKYAKTDKANVTITKTPERITVVVEDPGCGFDLATLPDRPSSHRGFGLFSIRERARLLGGEFTIQSRPGLGTICRLEAPIVRAGETAAAPVPPTA